MNVEIHDYQKRLESINRRISEASAISITNKQCIGRFRDECFARNIGAARVVRYLYALRDLAVWLNKDFESCTIEDIKKVVGSIEQMSQFSPRTKCEYRATLKKFYKWLRDKDDPEEVSWVDLRLKKHNDKLPSELLTEDEILAM